jgi:hypothetical protein
MQLWQSWILATSIGDWVVDWCCNWTSDWPATLDLGSKCQWRHRCRDESTCIDEAIFGTEFCGWIEIKEQCHHNKCDAVAKVMG